jgi:hypothetical protein
MITVRFEDAVDIAGPSNMWNAVRVIGGRAGAKEPSISDTNLRHELYLQMCNWQRLDLVPIATTVTDGGIHPPITPHPQHAEQDCDNSPRHRPRDSQLAESHGIIVSRMKTLPKGRWDIVRIRPSFWHAII